MGPIKEILAESQFQEELTTSSQAKLVVVDFTASWCGPCQTIAPFYEQLSRKYPNAVFLKVDVDKCQETAVNQRVSVMPTFHFYRNKVKVDSIQGADPQKLEEKILKYYDEGTGENDVGVAGHKKEGEKSKKEAGCVGPDSLKATSSTKNVQAKGLNLTSTSKLNTEVPTGACVSPADTKDGAQAQPIATEPLPIEYVTNNKSPSAETARTNIFSRLTPESKAPDVLDNSVSGVKSGDASMRITAALAAGTTLNDSSNTLVKDTSQRPNKTGQKGPVEVPKAVCGDQNQNSVDIISTIINPPVMLSKQLWKNLSPQPQSALIQKNPTDSFHKVGDSDQKKIVVDNAGSSISKAPTAISSKMSQKEATSQNKSLSAAPKAAVDVQKKTVADKREGSNSKTPSAMPSNMSLKEVTSQDKSSSAPKGPTVAAADGFSKKTTGDESEGTTKYLIVLPPLPANREIILPRKGER